SRSLYEPTRAFYHRCGYARAALLQDFYAPGDHKVIFVKVFPPAHRAVQTCEDEGSLRKATWKLQP
ncbi:MAG: hypothetical protein SWC40_12285, partial [Thermodesulfobacteriota bacterium]|nr:hypothetical protein [Thermodesulfobacteriota bacterium]